jgi:prepilin-type N-terminal cleavage/methylation domain-containing protein
LTNKGKHTDTQAINRKNWIKGFTLLEMLFVILLSAIVVSLTFLYFNAFNRYISQITRLSEYELQVLRMESLLTYDIDRAASIQINKDNTTFMSVLGTNVDYEFAVNYIVRIQEENSDTLKCEELLFSPEYNRGSNKTIKSFELQITDHNNRKRTYSFNKNQTSKMKYEEYWRNE